MLTSNRQDWLLQPCARVSNLYNWDNRINLVEQPPDVMTTNQHDSLQLGWLWYIFVVAVALEIDRKTPGHGM